MESLRIERPHRKNPQKALETQLAAFLEDKAINPKNKELLQDFFKAADLDSFTRRLGPKRRAKYVTLFRLIDKWFDGKPFKDITKEDFEKWYIGLNNNVICRINGAAYSQNSKATLKVMIKAVWKWLKGEGEYFPPEVKKFKPNWEKPDPKALKRSEVEKLAGHFKDLRYRFTTLFLFDSGFRIDECMQMRRRDLTIQPRNEGKEEYYLAECEVSKTKPRKVSVTLYPEAYSEFLKMYHSFSKDDTPLVNFSYEAYRKALDERANKVLGFRVTPHDLRKSSATYYAGILKDPYKLNKRMGWALTSDVAQHYLDASGISEESTVELVEANQVMDLRKQLDGERQKTQRLEEQFKDMQTQVMRLVADNVKKRLSSGKA